MLWRLLMRCGTHSRWASRKTHSCSLNNFVEINLIQLKEILDRLEQNASGTDISTMASLIQACDRLKALPEGKRIQTILLRSQLDHVQVLSDRMVQMYLKCGSVARAREMFSKISNHSVVSWTMMIAENAKNGQPQEAFVLLRQMQLEGVLLDKVTFIAVLNACSDPSVLEEGELIHSWIIESGFVYDVIVSNALINMYSKCGNLTEAQRVFDSMQRRDVNSWNLIIVACIRESEFDTGLHLYNSMQQRGVMPNRVTFLHVMKTCCGPEDLSFLTLIRGQVIESGCDSDTIVATAFVNMYSKCGNLADATEIFHRMAYRDSIAWNAMIAAFADYERSQDALQVYQDMLKQRHIPDKVTFLNIIKAITAPSLLAAGREIHVQVVAARLESDLKVGSALVDMYSKCGSLEDARNVFDKLEHPDVISWNTIMGGYAQHGHWEEAIELFKQMKVKPNKLTFIVVLNACAALGVALQEGVSIHKCLIESGFDTDTAVGNALLNMYTKCGSSLAESMAVFSRMLYRDLLSWNIIIAAYADRGLLEETFFLVQQLQIEGLVLDAISFVTMLNACCNSSALEQGRTIHGWIIESGFEGLIIVSTALLNMYGKCGSLEDARRVFDKMRKSERDLVSWNAMSSVYMQYCCNDQVHGLFKQMLIEGMKPDRIAFINVLTATSPEDVREVEKFHQYVMESGLQSDMMLATTLLSIYGKCGRMEAVKNVFNAMPEKDLASLNAMICALGITREALEIFESTDLQPDAVMFSLVLNVCAGLGAIAEGKRIHDRIMLMECQTDIGVATALVNMYGKFGDLERAQCIFETTPMKDVVLWNALISAYAHQGHGQRALLIFWQLLREGYRADAISFVSVLGACGHAGLVEDGCRFFASIFLDHGLPLTLEHYGCMINLFGRAGRLVEAEHFIRNLPIELSSTVAWRTLLSACGIHSDVIRGMHAAKCILKQDEQSPGAYVALANLHTGDSNTWTGSS